MPQRLVPPPPAITPSIVAPGEISNSMSHEDLLAEELASNYLNQRQSTGAQTSKEDELADRLASEYLQTQPPPQQIAQQLPPPIPQPKQPTPKPASKQQGAPAYKPAVTRKQPVAGAAPPAPPKPPPSVLQQATGDVLKGVDNFVGQGLKMAQGVPLLNGFIQQSQANSADVSKNPFEAAAATVAAAPAGALGFIDDLINIPAAQQGLGAPAHLREGYLGLPGIKRLTEAYPGASGTGEFGGAAAVPLGVPLGPLKAIKNPIARGAAHGAIAGGAFGTVTAGGQQAKRGERPNLGKAVQEGGLPGAILGTLAGGAGGKLTSKSKPKAPGAEAPKTPNPTADTVTLKDGSTFTPDEAMAHVDNPATPEAIKKEILEHLDARDQKIAGAAPEAKTEVKAELVKPEEGLKPAQPAMRLDPGKGPQQPQPTSDYTAPPLEPVKPLEDPALDAKLAQQDFENERFGKAYEPLETQSASLGKSKQREEGYLKEQEAVTAQQLTDSQLESHWQELEIDLKRPSTKQALEKKLSAQQDIINAETMRRAYRRKEGLEENWAKEPEPEPVPPDYENMPDEELARLANDAGDDNALMALLARQEAPQNKPNSSIAGGNELEALQDAQAPAIAPPETASPANLPEGTTDGALNFAPEQSTPQIAEIKSETAQPSNLYQYRKTAKGYEVYNEATGDVAKKNWSEAKTKEYVDGLNQKLSENPDFERSQGRRSAVAMQKGTSDTRQAIIADGQAMPETATPTVKAGLEKIAEAKHAYDELRARSEAAYDALREALGKPASIGFKKSNKYNKQVEEEFIRLGKDTPDQLSFEVQNSVKLEPEAYQFKPGMTAAEKGAEVLELMQQASKAKKALGDEKALIESELRAGIDRGEYPRSINIKHGKGTVNIRQKPKQFSKLGDEFEAALDAPGQQNIVRNQAAVKSWLKEPKDADANYQANANSTRPVRAKGVRSQTGAINLGLKKRHQKPAAQQQAPAPAAAAVAQGAHQSPQIADWANDQKFVGRIFEVRRALDITKDRSETLHNAVWEGIAKTTLQGRNIKFNPEHESLVHDSLRMNPNDIRMGANGLNVLSSAQRNYLATRRTVWQATGKQVKTEREAWLNQYGDNLEEMPNHVRHDYNVLQQLEDTLTGGTGKNDTGEFDALGLFTGGLYDYVFKWNPAYHGLNLLDPLVVGSSRAGIQRIMAAKMAQLDPTVKNFLSGIEHKSPIVQLRAETRLKTSQSAAIKPTKYSKIKKAVATLQGKLPDLPSEKWNFNDSLAAGIIMRGDKLKHQGGGVQYLKDMAGGKLSQDEMIKAMVDGLQVADDITGSGALGLNKDPVQRTPWAKYITQFTSQPYRVARLFKEYKKAGEYDKIATFLAMTAFVSGRAALPKELDLIKLIPHKPTRQLFFAVEDFLDTVNVVDDIPVIGRDLTEKMRYSFVPFLGGAQTNMLLESFERTLSDAVGLKLDKLGEAAIWSGLSAFIGGGGLEMGRIKREAGNAQKGDKDMYAPHPSPYGGNLRPSPKKSFKQVAGRPYNAGDALGNMILPGRSPVEGKYVKQAQRKRLDK